MHLTSILYKGMHEAMQGIGARMLEWRLRDVNDDA